MSLDSTGQLGVDVVCVGRCMEARDIQDPHGKDGPARAGELVGPFLIFPHNRVGCCHRIRN